MLKLAVNGSSMCRVHELGGCLLTVMYVYRSKYAIDFVPSTPSIRRMHGEIRVFRVIGRNPVRTSL